MISQEDLFGKCPYATTQKILTGKWSIVILHLLSEKTYRFNELQHQIPDVTQATLTKQLKHLEEYGLVIRTVYAQIPPKVEYTLSDIGLEFNRVLDSVRIWGDKYIQYNKLKRSNLPSS